MTRCTTPTVFYYTEVIAHNLDIRRGSWGIPRGRSYGLRALTVDALLPCSAIVGGTGASYSRCGGLTLDSGSWLAE